MHDARKMMAKLVKALSKAEICPFHGCLPKIVGKDIPPSGISREIWNEMTALEREAFMRKRYPNAFLFPNQGYTCFCEECAKNTTLTAGKLDRFAYGFSSLCSWSVALGNWNKACLRFVKSSIMKQLKGQ